MPSLGQRRRVLFGEAIRILRSDLEPSQLSQLDSAAPWVLSPSRVLGAAGKRSLLADV